jgi:hypothetical protein
MLTKSIYQEKKTPSTQVSNIQDSFSSASVLDEGINSGLNLPASKQITASK